MDLRIISWNVRGINDETKRQVIKAACRRWKPHMLCLQETKMGKVDRKVVLSVGGDQWTQWEHLDAIGASGGILVMWDSRVVTRVGARVGNFSVLCLFQGLLVDSRWVFSGIYGPCVDALRKGLWDELKLIPQIWRVPWCVGGDFNVVGFPHERFGARTFSQAMMEFNDFINEVELVDLPLIGGQFTWSRNSDTHHCSRIDRFLVSTDWLERFGGSSQSCLPRVISNHVPLWLECGSLANRKSPFRFENMWLKEPGFVGWIEEKWSGVPMWWMTTPVSDLRRS